MELCPALGIAIPVGKDSMSMKTVWQEGGEQQEVTAPLSLIISAFARVQDVRKTLTPELKMDKGDTDLILIDLGKGKNRLGGSCLAQVYKQLGHHPADLDDPHALKQFFNTVQLLNDKGLLLAYHDRSDGGLLATICEMAFAAHIGVNIQLDALGDDPMAALFSEELGAVIQVNHQDTDEVLAWLHDAGLGHHSHVIGHLNDADRIVFTVDKQQLIAGDRVHWQRIWLKPVIASKPYVIMPNVPNRNLIVCWIKTIPVCRSLSTLILKKISLHLTSTPPGLRSPSCENRV